MFTNRTFTIFGALLISGLLCFGQAQRPVSTSFGGSVPSGQATAETIRLSLDDAIARGLRYNLAIVQGGEEVRQRRAERLRALSALLPTLSLRPNISEQQVNLAAFGLPSLPGFPSVVGPFTLYDARAVGTEALSIQGWRRYKAGKEGVRSAELTVRDMREQVVLAVTSAWLQALSGAARIEAQRALVTTADTQYKQAVDRKNAGTVPAIDVLRSQVQSQAEQQRLIFYEGEFDKQKLILARAIGLPPGQAFDLDGRIGYTPLPIDFTIESALREAYAHRADYQSLEAGVREAELTKSSARAARLPSVGVDANYGVNGLSPTSMHGSFAVAAGVNIPLYQAGRVRAEVEAADATLRERRAALEDLRGQIDADVRNAFTDLRSAARRVEVATQGVDLAKKELEQAQDRFGAGVTNNLEVVQAQQSVSTANENYISSLYLFNTAKAALLRARGDAEQNTGTLLRSEK